MSAGGRPDMREAMASLLARAYAIGPGPDGEVLFRYPDGTPLSPAWGTGPGDGPIWTTDDLIAGMGFAAAMFVGLAFEVDAAHAEGRPVDVKEFIAGHQLALMLRDYPDPVAAARQIAERLGLLKDGVP